MVHSQNPLVIEIPAAAIPFLSRITSKSLQKTCSILLLRHTLKAVNHRTTFTAIKDYLINKLAVLVVNNHHRPPPRSQRLCWLVVGFACFCWVALRVSWDAPFDLWRTFSRLLTEGSRTWSCGLWGNSRLSFDHRRSTRYIYGICTMWGTIWRYM